MFRKLIVSFLGLVFVTTASAQRYAAGTTAAERLQLPKYCWALYIDEKLATDPQYTIPGSCGGGMNHLCPGLVLLTRASTASNPMQVRKDALSRAKGELSYTLKAMTPNCPLRPDTETAMARAKSLERVLK